MPGEGMHIIEVRRFNAKQAMSSLLCTFAVWDALQTPALDEGNTP